MVIDNITFKEDYHCYKKGQVVPFKNNLTIITGDNGSGKTSLYNCINALVSDYMPHTIANVLENERAGKVNSKCISFTKDLYSHARYFDENIDLQLRCMGSSSGQGLVLQLQHELAIERDILVLDEPDRGLSMAKETMVGRMILEYAQKFPNCQIIVFAHAKRIMEVAEEVLTLPEVEYISINDVDAYFDKYSLIELGDTKPRHQST